MTTLVLFDVDGTLLADSGITHLRAFAEALRALHGAEDPFEVRDGELLCAGTAVSGLVDAQILGMCLAHAGVMLDGDAGAEALRDLRVAGAAAYERLVRGGAPTGVLLPGVGEMLDALERRGARIGLLTGNTEEICAVKLAGAGLGARFPIGGFGGELAERALLFPVALGAARAHGWCIDALCYVGDTPLDVAAARDAGVPVIAVCTGRYGRAELASADAVLADLGVDGALDTVLEIAAGWQA